jgi:hypothetical protein
MDAPHISLQLDFWSGMRSALKKKVPAERPPTKQTSSAAGSNCHHVVFLYSARRWEEIEKGRCTRPRVYQKAANYNLVLSRLGQSSRKTGGRSEEEGRSAR